MKRKKIALFLMGFLIFFCGIRSPIQVKADELTTFPEDQKGSLTIRYFDDEDETIPVAKAEFDVYQVSTIGHGVEDNGKYLPLNDDLDFTTQEESDASVYLEKVIAAYDANAELGFTAHAVVGEDGTATITDMPAGAYLVSESQAARYHIKTTPFLVSVPEINDNNDAWNFNVVTNPKSNIAGDLKVTKKISGTDSRNATDTFSFRVRIADGEYRGVDGDGNAITVKDGDVVKLRGGQSFAIYDLPENSDYRIVEQEANQNGYTTTYDGQEGQITGKGEQEVTVTNQRNRFDYLTGVMANPVLWMECGGMLIALLLLYLLMHKKKGKEF